MKRLEKNQKIVLTNVAKLGGKWKMGDWAFGTNHRTENVLHGLTQCGLSEKVGEFRGFGIFNLTPLGLQLAATL